MWRLQKCGAGKFSATVKAVAETACQPCAAGQWAAEASAACRDCVAGKYKVAPAGATADDCTVSFSSQISLYLLHSLVELEDVVLFPLMFGRRKAQVTRVCLCGRHRAVMICR